MQIQADSRGRGHHCKQRDAGRNFVLLDAGDDILGAGGAGLR